MTDPLDPSATHGLDLHDAHHVSMDKFDLGHLNGLDDVDARELALGLSAADACLALAEVRIDCRGTPLNARM